MNDTNSKGMQVTSLESIDKMLVYPTIKLCPITGIKEDFRRNRYFTVQNPTLDPDIRYSYRIEWYKNICYLYHREMTVAFNYVTRSNTWPRESKMNLQFYTGARDNYHIACVIKIDDHINNFNKEESS